MSPHMKGPTHHRRVLHFAVTGALLGAAGCASKDPAKADVEETKTEAKKPEPEPDFAPNPGPNELEPPVKMVNPGVEEPPVAPTTAVEPKPELPELPEPEPDRVNEGPVEEPKTPVGEPKAPIEKHVNVGPKPEPEPKPHPVAVNPGPQG